MFRKFDESLHFLRSTAIGGLFFLLPLAVLVGLLGQVYTVVAAVAVPLGNSLPDWLPINTAVGIAFLFSASVALLVGVCFIAGFIARRAIGRRFSTTIEKQLITVFPKYAIYKDLLAGNLKHESEMPSLKPVLVSCPEGFRLALEADRLPGGWVVVFFPGAPDTWIGSVVIVAEDRVRSTSIDFSTTLGIFERLGRDSAEFFPTIIEKQ
jgi:uncharacterized membrane protein